MSKAKELLSIVEAIENEGLKIEDHGVLGKTLFLTINGQKYGYEAPEGKSPDSIKEIHDKFREMAKQPFNHGKALAWLKKNTKLASGSVKGIPKVVRGTDLEHNYRDTK